MTSYYVTSHSSQTPQRVLRLLSPLTRQLIDRPDKRPWFDGLVREQAYLVPLVLAGGGTYSVTLFDALASRRDRVETIGPAATRNSYTLRK
jgi:hypothetical protein